VNTIEYKGYVGSVELDTDRNVLRGEVINIDDVVTYKGSTVAGLIKEFHKSIEVYLEFCRKRGEQPNKRHGSIGGYSVGQVCNLPGTESHGRLQTCPTLPVTSIPEFLNHALRSRVYVP